MAARRWGFWNRACNDLSRPIVQVERGSRFRQLTEAERDEIISGLPHGVVRPGQAGLVEMRGGSHVKCHAQQKLSD